MLPFVIPECSLPDSDHTETPCDKTALFYNEDKNYQRRECVVCGLARSSLHGDQDKENKKRAIVTDSTKIDTQQNIYKIKSTDQKSI
jgi:hypothetical protein